VDLGGSGMKKILPTFLVHFVVSVEENLVQLSLVFVGIMPVFSHPSQTVVKL
jgi:hypothetical protein